MQTDQQIKKAKIIWDYLNIKDPPKKADAIFVLGGSTLFPAKQAAKLFKAGFASEIFFCSINGTFSNSIWKKPESEIYAQELNRLGVPQKNIHWQLLSNNTLEEVQKGIVFVRKFLPNLKKLILVSRPFHQRRAWATFQKQYPEIEYINSPGPETLVATDLSLNRLLAEVDRLERYSAKGDIVRQQIPDKVIKARNFLSSLPKKDLTTWVEVSRSSLRHNVLSFKKILPQHTKIIAVIKSNAYGHGLVGTAKALESDVDYLAVASIEEALELRREKVKGEILVLSILGFNQAEIIKAIKRNIQLTIFDEQSLALIKQATKQAKVKAKVHIKFDTGMSRLGFGAKETADFIIKAKNSRLLQIEGIFSHLSSADSDLQFTKLQCQRFKRFISQFPEIPIQHLFNTPGVMSGLNLAGNAVRLGLGVYGLMPSKFSQQNIKKNFPDFNLQPALSWKTRIIQNRDLNKGVDISYGRTYTTLKKIKVAVLPVGYWDGLARKLSNQGEVLIQGQRCAIVGRVCMNHTIVNISNLKNIKVGDEVVLLGRDGAEEITAEELTKKIGTINYGIISRINPLLPRIYV